MANVSNQVDMEPTYVPFERPPDLQALWSAIPRGLRGFKAELATLAAKPLNDTETFKLTGILPVSFAYVFAEISLRLTQDLAANWKREYLLNLQSFYQGTVTLSQSWTYLLDAIGIADSELVDASGSRDHSPRSPMWAPRGTSGIQISINGSNAVAAAAAAGTISAYINFWEFDLEQVRKFPINAPLPTHSR